MKTGGASSNGVRPDVPEPSFHSRVILEQWSSSSRFAESASSPTGKDAAFDRKRYMLPAFVVGCRRLRLFHKLAQCNERKTEESAEAGGTGSSLSLAAHTRKVTIKQRKRMRLRSAAHAGIVSARGLQVALVCFWYCSSMYAALDDGSQNAHSSRRCTLNSNNIWQTLVHPPKEQLPTPHSRKFSSPVVLLPALVFRAGHCHWKCRRLPVLSVIFWYLERQPDGGSLAANGIETRPLDKLYVEQLAISPLRFHVSITSSRYRHKVR